MGDALGSVSAIVESIQGYGGDVLFALLLLPWLVLGMFLPSILRRTWFERKQINSVITRYHRIEKGCCPDCGYDLRGSPERCPECGHPMLWYQVAREKPKP